MGVFTDTGKNAMLDEGVGVSGTTAKITHAALFNGIPGGGGTELSDGGAGYARQPITMVAASGGAVTITADATFNVDSGDTVNYVGYYTDLTAGTLIAYDDVTQEVFGADGQYILDSSTFTI